MIAKSNWFPFERDYLYQTYDVGPETQRVQRGLEMKDLQDLKHLTMDDEKPLVGDE